MNKSSLFNYTVGEVMDMLQQYPADMPVVVSGYENGYENFYHPYVKKVTHMPENSYYEGEFQLDDKGIDVLLLERVLRDD